ncbi:hypothetical protein [Carboxylicivirga caseinilyticus]|uniref:hypothetical protein n=1 Tax=Carboxylicivirga caseinilyticus TaxID=3417572 RepID=UPI003D339142|nr:hypothetical protein [Marinilabiliaceae bacterium A049]
MKTIFKSLISMMMLALLLVSCEEEALDSLDGVYTHPDVCDYTVIDSQSRDKEGTLFAFSINLKDDASNTLNLLMYSTNYALPSSDYTASETASNKTYLIGESGSTCNGQQISSGTISVIEDGSGNYEIEGIIYLADETVVRMTGSFSIVYEYIPIYTYSVETESVYDSNYQVISGIVKQKITVYADGVSYANLEVTTDESATTITGTYSIAESLSAANQAAAGYYLDLSWFGWGTDVMYGGCYYTQDGETLYARSGDITISETDSKLTFSGTNLAIQDVEATEEEFGTTYTYPTLDEAGSFEFSESNEALTNTLSSIAYSDGTAYSTYLMFSTSGVTSTYYADYYTWVHAGNGSVINLQIYGLSDATLTEGTYTVSSSPSSGDIVAGYLHSTYYYDAGSVLTTVVDDVASNAYVNSGTVEVIADGDDFILVLDLETDNGSYQTTYAGSVAVTVY